MFKNAVEVDEKEIPESFAEYFASKISSLMVNIAIDPNVYNGNRRITSTEENFMTSQNILRAVQSIKMKNAEGGDRIPQRILIDGISVLIRPLSKLFEKIYEEKSIPEQWKMAKITPVHKKGSRSDISNYRPVANLCSASKIYENG